MINKAKYKICRRLGAGVFEKCQTQKFALSEGRHAKVRGTKRRKMISEYGTQLIEKQKVRFSYGVSEKQFSNYVKKASEKKGFNSSDSLYEFLESRFDNTIYRLGIAHTRRLARQMVAHGHFLVNGTRLKIPSYQVKNGDIITVREGSKKSVLFTNLAKKLKDFVVPAWLGFDANKVEGKITGVPKNDQSFLDFSSVMEFYSR
ncbi:30S ribosomal protein S4 [Candidatus Wolfebacteria bacterium]|nr:MAG: 30S ribosomal protein S4 [Candidatus Wolfebacteria bacterium]